MRKSQDLVTCQNCGRRSHLHQSRLGLDPGWQNAHWTQIEWDSHAITPTKRQLSWTVEQFFGVARLLWIRSGPVAHAISY
jgi:hypothetical protein